VQPASSPLFDTVRAWAGARGIALVGAMGASEFDRVQPVGRRVGDRWPRCDTLLLLGTGGRQGLAAVERDLGEPVGPARPEHHPIDAWSLATAFELLAGPLAHHPGVVVLPDDRGCPNLRQLAEMVGFGVVSPVIHHLLHPTYGPWVSLRALILIEGRPFGDRPAKPLTSFEPCAACERPCVRACPASVYDTSGRTELSRCWDQRVAGGCRAGCETLRACPVGREHRYSERDERFRHDHALFRIEAARRPGWLRFLRRG
jgi:hypothetical protein